MTNLQPKCLSGQLGQGHAARGYILPCCYWDVPDLFESEIADLVQEKFKLSDVGSVQEILESEEWIKFYNDLNSGNAPSHCLRYCSGNPIKI
jgi:hypothetical protein